MPRLSFAAFLKLNALSAIGFGIVLGLLNPLGALLGFEIVAGVEAPWLTGVRAWLVYLVAIPAVFALLSLVFSVETRCCNDALNSRRKLREK